MMTRSKLLIAALATVATVVVAGIATLRSRDSEPRPNVILISIDTLRADHLGCYGYARSTTPAIDAFRSESVLFRTAIASAPSTLPSHASIFTSLAPQHHGASHTHAIPLGDDFVTLTEVLREHGYATAAYTGGAQLAPECGLDQGFETYEVTDQLSLESLVARAEPFVRDAKRRPFFLFLHTYEVHHPYRPSPEDLRRVEPNRVSSLPPQIEVALLEKINSGGLRISDDDRAHIVNTYDAEIVAMDRGFRALVALLQRARLYEKSIIVFTSDHGEEFNEHGFMGWHSHTLYDELLRVPLIVRLPRGEHAGVTVEGVTQGVDIAPMILEAAGVPRPSQFRPFSLAGALARRRTPAAETLLWMESPPNDPVRHNGLRTPDWKLVDGRLYDLRSDPGESTNVAASRAEVSERLAKRMNALIRERPLPDTRAIAPDQETIQRLRALGYLR
jgi:arylsulfatase A-like enzyme